MFAWINKFFNNEEFFVSIIRRWPVKIRFAVAFLGYLMQQGFIPTGIPGGGSRYGTLLMICSLLIKAGEFNDKYNDSNNSQVLND